MPPDPLAAGEPPELPHDVNSSTQRIPAIPSLNPKFRFILFPLSTKCLRKYLSLLNQRCINHPILYLFGTD